MSLCPDCDTKLEAHKGKRLKHTLRDGTVIRPYKVKWYCPKEKKYKKNSKAELMAMGKLRGLGL